MAKVYEAWEGKRPLRGPHFADKPLGEIIHLLRLHESIRMRDSGEVPPAFSLKPAGAGSKEQKRPDAVYVKVEKEEAHNRGRWKSGWYLLRITPTEARRRLGL